MSDYGTETRGGGGVTFFGIRMGKDSKNRPCAVMATKAPAGSPGAIQAFNKDGTPSINQKTLKENWYSHYNYIEGQLASIESKTVDMAKGARTFINFTIYGKSTVMVLSLEKYDRYWVDFMKRLLNVDLTKPMRIRPFAIKEKDSDRTNSLLIPAQDGQNVPLMWNAANKWGQDEEGNGGLPSGERVESTTTGELVWSFLKRDRFLEAMVQNQVAKELEAMVQNGEIKPPAGVSVPEPQPADAGRDDGPDAGVDSAFDGGADIDDQDLPF